MADYEAAAEGGIKEVGAGQPVIPPRSGAGSGRAGSGSKEAGRGIVRRGETRGRRRGERGRQRIAMRPGMFLLTEDIPAATF